MSAYITLLYEYLRTN